jgi:hypothetical protein
MIALRLRDGRRLDPLPAAEVLARISALTEVHSPDLWDLTGYSLELRLTAAYSFQLREAAPGRSERRDASVDLELRDAAAR